MRNFALTQIFLDLTKTEFTFAQKLGIEFELVGDGGSGGARFVFNRYRKIVAVIKPGDEGPHGVNNPKWWTFIKQWFISPKKGLLGNLEPLAEVDSWAWDRSFQIWSVPPTWTCDLESSTFVGSRQKACSIQFLESFEQYKHLPLERFGAKKNHS